MSQVEHPAAGRPGEYQVVARRYRPQSFAELVGQSQVATALSNAIATSRVGHAYLFCGARGTGKTSTARIFAKCLNCVTGPTATPCGVCDACVGITAGSDVDVLEIDGASNRGIDEIRELRANVNIRPSRARFKVYIIDEVHMFTKEAFNALLKTLEEPPEHVKFILCTTDPEKLPITVLSRCQRFDFTPIETRSIKDRLKLICDREGVAADDEALHLLARRANGSMRDSQSLLEQILAFGGKKITVDEVHSLLGTVRGGRLAKFIGTVLARDTAAALTEIDAAIAEGVDPGQFAEQLLGYLRDMMAAAVGAPPELLLHNMESEHAALKEAGTQWGVETLLAASQIVDQTLVRMRQTTHGRTLLEIAVVRLCELEDLRELAKLVAQLKTGAPDSASAKKKSDVAVGPSDVERASRPVRVAPAALPTPASPPSTVVSRSPDRDTPVPRSPDRSQWSGQETGPQQPPPVANAQGSESGARGSESGARGSVSGAQGSVSDARGSQEENDARTGREARSTSPAIPLTMENAERIWKEVVHRLDGLVREAANSFSGVVIPAPHRLAVRFARKMSMLDQPERRAELERMVSGICGEAVKLEFAVVTPEAVAPPAPIRTSKQLQQETVRNPFVKLALEMFDCDVIRVHESPAPVPVATLETPAGE